MPAGDLRYQSIDDVLRWIESAGASGALEIGRGEHALTIYFHAGKLTFADQAKQSPTTAELDSAGIDRTMWDRALGRPGARSSVSASLLAEGVPREAVEAFALRRITLAVQGLRKLWAGRFHTTDAVHPFGTAVSIDPSQVWRSPIVGNGDDRFDAVMALIPTDRFQVTLNGSDWSALSELLAPFRHRDLVERLGKDAADHLFVTLQRAELAQIIPADLTVVPAEPAMDVEAEPVVQTEIDPLGHQAPAMDDETERVDRTEIDPPEHEEPTTDDQAVVLADLQVDAVPVDDGEMPDSVEIDRTGTVDLLDFVDVEACAASIPEASDELLTLESATPAVTEERIDQHSDTDAPVLFAASEDPMVDAGRSAPPSDEDSGHAVDLDDTSSPIDEPVPETGEDLGVEPDTEADASDTRSSEFHSVDDQDLLEPGSGFPFALIDSEEPPETDDHGAAEATLERTDDDFEAHAVSPPDDRPGTDALEVFSFSELDDVEGVDPPFDCEEESVVEPASGGSFGIEDGMGPAHEAADPSSPNLDVMLDDMMPLSETMVGSGPAEGDRPQDPTEPVGAPEISGSGVSVANATEADAATATSDPPELDEFGLVGPEISKVSVGSGDAGERNGATRKPSDIGMYEHRSLRSRITAVLHEEEADADDVGTNDLPESPDGDSYGEGAYRLVSDLRRQMDEPEETEVSTLRRLITAITRL